MSLSVPRRLRQPLRPKRGPHSDADLLCYSFDATVLSHIPNAIAHLDSEDDIALILAFADCFVMSNPSCFMQLQIAKTRWNKGWSLSHISQVLSVSLHHGSLH
jgi:hypothetical protein